MFQFTPSLVFDFQCLELFRLQVNIEPSTFLTLIETNANHLRNDRIEQTLMLVTGDHYDYTVKSFDFR